MKKTAFLTVIVALCFGCAIDDTVPTKKDAGSTQTGSAGSGPMGTGGSTTTGSAGATSTGPATGGGGVGGSGGPMGAGGQDASAGSAGMGGTPAGMGGTGGTAGASGGMGGTGGDVDAGDMDAGSDAFPEASTCAGYALQFDGTTFATVTRMVQDDFTLEAWMKTTIPSLTGTMFFNGNGLIYADVGGAADDFGTALINNHFSLGVGNPDTTVQGTTDVTSGQWFHVAATRKATTGVIQVFVGGALEGELTVTNTRPLSAQSMLTIGGNTIDSRYFTGLMDEVRIWNVVRSAADITSTMHQRLAGNETGLVGYWRFDEPGVAVLVDSSPTQASATLFGNPQWVPSDAPVCPRF